MHMEISTKGSETMEINMELELFPTLMVLNSRVNGLKTRQLVREL